MGLDSWIYEKESNEELAYFRKDYELHDFFYQYFLTTKEYENCKNDDYINDPFNGYHLKINLEVVENAIVHLCDISEHQETDEYEYSIDKLYDVVKYLDRNPKAEIYYTCSY